ncbi:BH0509 family protein [Bacillus subtilis]|nr:BH0509 family protein [Bacillus subtilis]
MELTERQHLIEWLVLLGGAYGRTFLETKSDDELEKLYNLRIKQLNEE